MDPFIVSNGNVLFDFKQRFKEALGEHIPRTLKRKWFPDPEQYPVFPVRGSSARLRCSDGATDISSGMTKQARGKGDGGLST